jgi:hypothetical protein
VDALDTSEIDVCNVAGGGGGTSGETMGVVAMEDGESCEAWRSGEYGDIERASMFPGNDGYPTARCCSWWSILLDVVLRSY